MIITLKFLKSKNACQSGIENVIEWELIGKNHPEFIKGLMDHNRFDYANWLLTRLFKTKKQYVQYAIYAAGQVIDIFEKKYPDDKRPRKAIEAAKAYLKNPSIKTKSDAYAAAVAAHAAYAAAAYAAYAAAYAAYAAAYAATHAAAADDAAKTKIIDYGMTLLKSERRIKSYLKINKSKMQ